MEMESGVVIVRGWGVEGRSERLMKVALQLGKMKKFLKRVVVMVIECEWRSGHSAVHLKRLQIVNFMLNVSYN